MKKWSLVLASFLLLAACSDDKETSKETTPPADTEAPAEVTEMVEEGFITQVTGNEILVNNIYFSITDEVAVDFDNGTETTDGVISDIRTGMKVSVDYKGPLAESFPMQGEADTVSILNDEESASQAEALTAFIEGEQLPRLIMMGQPIVRDNEIGFLFTNMENNEMSEVRIDLDTHEYTIGGE